MHRLLAILISASLTAACSGSATRLPPTPATPGPTTHPSVGILVMAHGGDPVWNASVDAALAPLRAKAPLALAFGMADRSTLQAGVDSLAATGVERVAVVRLFLSGRSFEEQTRYLLGLDPTPPAHFLHHGGPHGAGGHVPPPVAAPDMTLATHRDGLMDWSGVGTILLERARASRADHGGVLVLGHGMGDEDENRAVLQRMDAAATELRRAGLGPIDVETLREDWPEARTEAEARIRGWIDSRVATDGTPVVVPFRLSGFGPYAEVLDGLSYRAADGLLPHPSVMDWVEMTAARVACREGWAPPVGVCGT